MPLPSPRGLNPARHNRESKMILKSTLIVATATAIALTSFDLRPAAAAPEGGPAIAKQNAGADEISSQRRKRRRGVNPAIPLAAFGAVMGVIGGVAAANSRRDYYGAPAYGYYEPPAYQYYEQPVYHRGYQHRGYEQRGHQQRGYQQRGSQQRDYYSRWGGSGGQPGYRGPNVNVPGATNYGNAAGQNGQAPPASPGTSQNAGGSN
jgi:hypothetical protein